MPASPSTSGSIPPHLPIRATPLEDSETPAPADVVGPGTQAVSLSLLKTINFTERIRIRIGAQVANVFNHPNFAVPGSLTVGVAGFGQITALQTAEGAGPRDIQLTGRINF